MDWRHIAEMMAAGAGFPHEDELVLATVEATHPAVGLDPDNEVLELTVNGVAGGAFLARKPNSDIVFGIIRFKGKGGVSNSPGIRPSSLLI
jgi:hypothetical protein